jgi:hypothetical protein
VAKRVLTARLLEDLSIAALPHSDVGSTSVLNALARISREGPSSGTSFNVSLNINARTDDARLATQLLLAFEEMLKRMTDEMVGAE